MSACTDMETDSDVVVATKKKLSEFRLKELKDVLSQVGLSKQGRKQDLVDRILALLYDEGTPGVFKNNVNGKEGLLEIIEVTYKKFQEVLGSDSNTKKHGSSSGRRSRPKEEVDESCQIERKIRCPCGSDLPHGAPMVQCMDPSCNVWQHIGCVIIPERPLESTPTPTQFLCELCRVKRADPFWAVVAHPLSSVKLVPLNIPADGTNPHVSVEKTFKLTRADRDLLQKKTETEYGVQVWCMLLNDTVPFRIQWPQYADLQINGNPIRTVNRPGSQQLGANGRDNGAEITSWTMEGVNKLSLSFTDARTFCFGVRLVRRRTLEQVFGMIPKETEGETFEDALARIHRCIGGGITAGNDDSDSDLEVIADSVPVSLRCPMSGSRMKTSGRFRPCAHMGCFDLETLVEINERTRKWQCPICLKNYSLEDIIVDPFFNRILHMMKSCAEEINEIDMKPNGSWRVKKGRDVGDLAKWHRPDGSIEEFHESNTGKELALECNPLTLDIQKTVVGASLLNQEDDDAENQAMNIITMSSTTTINDKDDENPSINQGGDENLDASNGNEPEVSSSYNFFGRERNPGFPATDADVIVLSDSEEDDDDVSLINPEESFPVDCSLKGELADAPTEDQIPFSRNQDEHLTSLGTSGIVHFGTSDAVRDDYESASYARHNNGNVSLESSMDPVPHMVNSSDCQNSTLDHELTLGNGDAALDLPCPSVFREEPPLVNTSSGEHGNFLNIGGNGHECSSNNAEARHVSACEALADLQNQFQSSEDPLIQRKDDEPESGSLSGSGSDNSVKRKRSDDGPFSFPRQKRSARRGALLASSSNILSE